MNSVFLYEYMNDFERVLSFAYKKHYSLNALERLISYSSFFQKIEKSSRGLPPIITDTVLAKSMFVELDVDLNEIPVLNQCLWASEAYLRIQESTRLTFEAIFLYFPISRMYDCFDVYHEMDFSQIINAFKEEYEKESILALLIKRYKYSLVYLSEQTGVPYGTLYSLKTRRRDIKSLNVQHLFDIAAFLNVRIETLAEVKQ